MRHRVTGLPGLRDAALVSLAYETGLRVSEFVQVAVELVAAEADGSVMLTVPNSKTDPEGQGGYAWLSPDTMRRITAWLKGAGIIQKAVGSSGQ